MSLDQKKKRKIGKEVGGGEAPNAVAKRRKRARAFFWRRREYAHDL